MIGTRPRSASRASRKRWPFMIDAVNTSAWRPSFHADASSSQTSPVTFTSASGRAAIAAPASSKPSMPEPVITSVIVVRRSANAVPARGVLSQPLVAIVGAHLDRVEHDVFVRDTQRDVALTALARKVGREED